MLTVMAYRFEFDSSVVRALLLAMALAAIVLGTAALFTALTPVIIGCCAKAMPVVGQLLFGSVLIYAFAKITKPRGA